MMLANTSRRSLLGGGMALAASELLARGSPAWAAVQGVSEFADQWDAPRSNDRANRFLFGQSGALLDRAFATALDLIKT